MNSLERIERNALMNYVNFLGDQALQVHFDSAQRLVIQGSMTERTHVKIGSQLAVESRKQIQVECGGHTR
jgi:hypothetical protein